MTLLELLLEDPIYLVEGARGQGRVETFAISALEVEDGAAKLADLHCVGNALVVSSKILWPIERIDDLDVLNDLLIKAYQVLVLALDLLLLFICREVADVLVLLVLDVCLDLLLQVTTDHIDVIVFAGLGHDQLD